jgi:hypothetical protein
MLIEQSGQVSINALNSSFTKDLLHFERLMRVACFVQLYSLRISAHRSPAGLFVQWESENFPIAQKKTGANPYF